VELALYRIFQEAIANALKHAHAQRILVELERERSGITLRVTDDGRGFALRARRSVANRSSLGLVNMRERAEFIGGTLTVNSVPREGTAIEVWAPLTRSLGKKLHP
jgi:signal transduction histidine kinase